MGKGEANADFMEVVLQKRSEVAPTRQREKLKLLQRLHKLRGQLDAVESYKESASRISKR